MQPISWNWGVIVAVFLGLALFGIANNSLIAWAERRGYTEGLISLFVAAGCLVTIGGLAILSIQVALLTLGAFIASGIPMIIGSLTRYLIAREKAQKALKDLTDAQSPRLAE
jgi:ACR3 family arsenite efflux pump ArsB